MRLPYLALMLLAVALVIAVATSVVAGQVNYGTIVSGGVIQIFWNETGVYVTVQQMQNISVLKHVVNAFYDLSNYSFMNVTLNLTAGCYVSIYRDGTYSVSCGYNTSNATLYLDPGVCVSLNGRFYCGFESGAEYTFTSPPGPVHAGVYFNSCLTVVVQKVVESAPSVTFDIQVYDYYTQHLIAERTISDEGYFTVCGVPDIVLLNITAGDRWLGMFYVTFRLPTVTFPRALAVFAPLIPLGVFITLVIRNRTGLAGLGAIVYGVFFPIVVSAFGLHNIYTGSQIALISSLSILLGVVMLLYTSKR